MTWQMEDSAYSIMTFHSPMEWLIDAQWLSQHIIYYICIMYYMYIYVYVLYIYYIYIYICTIHICICTICTYVLYTTYVEKLGPAHVDNL